MIKVVHLTSVHPWNDTRILKKECVSLKSAGFEVVLVCSENEPVQEEYDGVRILTTKKFQSRFLRATLGSFLVFKKALKERAGVYHFHDPELFFWAFVLRILGFKVVADIHENYPKDISAKHWVPDYAKKTISVVMDRVIRTGVKFLSGTVFADDEMKVEYGEHLKKVISVKNYLRINRSFIKNMEVFERETPSIVFFGGVMKSRVIAEFVESLEILMKTNDFNVYIAGNHCDNVLFERIQNSTSWSRIKYLGKIDGAEMEQLYREASISINLFADLPNNYNVRSNRVFESMGTFTPVVVSDFGDWPKFIQENQCGISVNPHNPISIAQGVKTLLDNPSLLKEYANKGRELALEHYDWQMEMGKLEQLYLSIK